MRAALSFLILVLGAAGMLGSAWAFICLDRGQYLTAVVVSGAVIFSFGMVAMLSRLTARNVTVRTGLVGGATVFRPDRTVDICLMTATVAMWAAMVLYAVFAPLDMVELPLPRGDRKFLIGVAIAGALAGLPSLRQIFVKASMSYLRLAPDGFELGSATSSVAREWDDVTDMSDRPATRRRPLNTGTTYITTTDGRTRVLPSDWYTPGGHALRTLVRFYWQHPESRDELADGRAVKRLESLF